MPNYARGSLMDGLGVTHGWFGTHFYSQKRGKWVVLGPMRSEEYSLWGAI